MRRLEWFFKKNQAIPLPGSRSCRANTHDLYAARYRRTSLFLRLANALRYRLAAAGTNFAFDRLAVFFTRRTPTGLTHFLLPKPNVIAARQIPNNRILPRMRL